MYVMNVVASDPDKYRHLTKLVRVFIKRSSIYFALGLRFLFLFLPAIMWCARGASASGGVGAREKR